MTNIRRLLLLSSVVVLVVLLNLLLVYFERSSGSGIEHFGDAIWYMFVTLTTVGYGDLYPHTVEGKIIGYVYVFSSLGVLGFLFSTVSNRIYTYLEEKKLGFHGMDYTNHILFIGWDDFSRLVAEEVYHTSKKMAIVTNKRDDIDLIYEQFGKENTFVLFADYQNLDSLDKVGAAAASSVFVSFKDDAQALLYILDFKKKYPQPDIVVSLEQSRLKDTFQSAGVTYAIARNEIASKLVASYIFEPDVANMNTDLLSASRTEDDFDIQEYCVTPQNPYVNQNCKELFFNLKNDYDVVLLGISKKKSSGQELITNPDESVKVEESDYLVVLSNGLNKKRLIDAFGVEEGNLG